MTPAEAQNKVLNELQAASSAASEFAQTLLTHNVAQGNIVDILGRLMACIPAVVVSHELDEDAVIASAERHIEPFKAMFPEAFDN